MGERVTGDRVEKIARRELDRKDLDGVLVGGVLTDARAPVRNGGVVQQGQVGGVFSLTVEELDANPSVSRVSKIVVPNDRLTDDGGGQVTLDFGSFSLAVEELDGDPSVENVTKIKVSNESVTDNGGGSVTIELGPKTFFSVPPDTTPPTPIPGRVNLWENPNGHLHWYSNVALDWLKLSGYI